MILCGLLWYATGFTWGLAHLAVLRLSIMINLGDGWVVTLSRKTRWTVAIVRGYGFIGILIIWDVLCLCIGPLFNI